MTDTPEEMSRNERSFDEQIIDRILAGKASEDEQARYRAWEGMYPHDAKHLTLIQQALEAGPVAIPSYSMSDIDAYFAKVTANRPSVRFDGSVMSRSGSHSVWRSGPMRIALGVAATLAVVVGVTALRRTGNSSTSHVYRAAAGELSVVRLADGSVVTLAPATTLQSAGDQMTLHGEAYFSIAPHAARPLSIHTANAVVHVLGTRFLVRQYPEERLSRVVVEDGRVSLEMRHLPASAANRTILSARMVAQISDSNVTVSNQVSTNVYTEWMRGRMVFNEVPLRDVLAELGRAYAADVRLADTVLARQPVTLQASVRSDPLAQILDLIAQAVNARVVRTDSSFVLVRGAATPRSSRKSNSFLSAEKSYGR
jgi:ferric-dicitrate binding protein FerR (iron transport regulator)